MMNVLLITPPMTQLNTPYPATAYLTGFLRSQGVAAVQADPGLLWILRILSRNGVRALAGAMQGKAKSVAHFLKHTEAIAAAVEPAIAFLQGRDTSLAHRFASRRYLVEGPRFSNLGPAGHEEQYLDWAFGTNGLADRARYFASLFIEDIADAVREGVDAHFDFSRYGEALAASTPTFDPLLAALQEKPLTAQWLDEVTDALLREHAPDVVGMTLPFPGNVLGALRMAARIRETAPKTRIVWGGGYVNTELRDLSDARVFDFVDAITFDDGERPFVNLIEHYAGKRAVSGLLRARVREGGAIITHSSPVEHDVPLRLAGTPTYAGLPLKDYLGIIDLLNPMHRLWSDTRWNKLTVAHGCYWKKCSFCDVSLDYIGNYDPVAADLLVDRIEVLIQETETRGFHFVDEAAPPAGLKGLATALLKRNVDVAWWGNIRFEKTFTPALCDLLAKSGCIAVSGGLEVASNRLLSLMQKGVTVEQVARVTRAFSDAGIRVHAYLMYGFPTQTEQETIDSLEMVRQLFAAGCLDSAFWHRFSATAHSPVGKDPQKYGIRLLSAKKPTFAENDLAFEDPTGTDHATLGEGLKKAVYNYMLGLGLDEDVRVWFSREVPKTKVKKRFIAEALGSARGSR